MYRRPVFRTNVFTRRRVRPRPSAAGVQPFSAAHLSGVGRAAAGTLRSPGRWGEGETPTADELWPRAIGPPPRPRANREPGSGRRRPAETARPTRRLIGFPGDFPRPPGCPPLGRRSSRNPNRYNKSYAARSPIAAAAAAAETTWYVS